MAEQQTEPQAITCHWHPGVSTGLSCSQCRRPICTECLVQAPVGIRCRECGRAQPLPTFDVRPAFYVRAAVVAAVIAVIGVFLGTFLAMLIGGLAFVVMPLAVGYAAGEVISRVVNLKRSRGLMCIAGGTVVFFGHCVAVSAGLSFAGPVGNARYGRRSAHRHQTGASLAFAVGFGDALGRFIPRRRIPATVAPPCRGLRCR